jgi:hypothetical protein
MWTSQSEDRIFELLWVRVGLTFIAALYHPPKPIYQVPALLDHIEASVEEISQSNPGALILLAGDFNQLPDQELIERTGLTQIVRQPTRGCNILDRIYVSCPMLYGIVRVVESVVKSDHKAIIACSRINKCEKPKTKLRRTYRPVTPNQHAQFQNHIATNAFGCLCSNEDRHDTQQQADHFYKAALELLDKFYPEKTVTISSRDPAFITPGIKARLRKKNRLVRSGRLEEAGALAKRISKDIKHRNQTLLQRVEGKMTAHEVWSAVRRLIGRTNEVGPVDGVSAESLNSHYASISEDRSYLAPKEKSSVALSQSQKYITQWQIFKILDHLRPTATGLDLLPAWFLRVGAPAFSEPIARLFNLSVANSVVPSQWKQAYIQPVPKVLQPTQHSDYRPISITPVLTRIIERTVTGSFLYPSFKHAPPALDLSDQYAFRPTGSTVAALIHLLQVITSMLANNEYVIVLCLDFSKAFDTVRHHTLMEKMAQLDLPDQVYNWLVAFFTGHTHCTLHHGDMSAFLAINASIIQGSAIGPPSYVVNAADFKVAVTGNAMVKFADDTYIVIPSTNVESRQAEVDHAASWAKENNLKVNQEKYKEVVFYDRRRLRQGRTVPPPLEGISRVSTVKILGVLVSDTLAFTEHVDAIISSGAQTLHALRVLRGHGMGDDALQRVFQSVIVAKLQYASSAWWGFSNAKERKRIEAFIQRSRRSRFVPEDLPEFEDICRASDDSLFRSILNDPHHVLHHLLPTQSAASQNYNLRRRVHKLQIPARVNSLNNNNFMTRMLYRDIY